MMGWQKEGKERVVGKISMCRGEIFVHSSAEKCSIGEGEGG